MIFFKLEEIPYSVNPSRGNHESVAGNERDTLTLRHNVPEKEFVLSEKRRRRADIKKRTVADLTARNESTNFQRE